jgi:hypothetical protein
MLDGKVLMRDWGSSFTLTGIDEELVKSQLLKWYDRFQRVLRGRRYFVDDNQSFELTDKVENLWIISFHKKFYLIWSYK